MKAKRCRICGKQLIDKDGNNVAGYYAESSLFGWKHWCVECYKNDFILQVSRDVINKK